MNLSFFIALQNADAVTISPFHALYYYAHKAFIVVMIILDKK